VFCNVLRGLPKEALIELLDFFDSKLIMARDVERELNGLSQSQFPDLQHLKTVREVGEYLRAPAVRLDPDQAADVELIVNHSGLFTPDPDRPRKNWGEVATVLLASRRQAAALMDDHEGRTFARRRGVATFSTREVVVLMSQKGSLTPDEAYAVWREAASSNRSREHFEDNLAQA
jgi:hypothetical protein